MKRFFLSERVIMIAILLNAAVIFMLYFPQFRHNEWLERLDHLFIIFFLIEALIKIKEWKPRHYFSSGWNIFDFLIVVASLPSLSSSFLNLADTSPLMLLRLFRLIRLVRFISFVPNLGMVVEGLGRAMKASVFVLIVLFFFNFILAVFTCHLYGHISPEYFGNPLVSAYSIFQLFTLEGWNEIPAVLAKSMDDRILLGLTRFYFVLIVLIGGIFGMSMANAIFVDEMTMDNNQVLEEKIDYLQQEIAELKELIEKNAQKNTID